MQPRDSDFKLRWTRRREWRRATPIGISTSTIEKLVAARGDLDDALKLGAPACTL
jgi:hypothetical protein